MKCYAGFCSAERSLRRHIHAGKAGRQGCVRGGQGSGSDERERDCKGQICGGRPQLLPRQGPEDESGRAGHVPHESSNPQYRQLPLRPNHPSAATGETFISCSMDAIGGVFWWYILDTAGRHHATDLRHPTEPKCLQISRHQPQGCRVPFASWILRSHCTICKPDVAVIGPGLCLLGHANQAGWLYGSPDSVILTNHIN